MAAALENFPPEVALGDAADVVKGIRDPKWLTVRLEETSASGCVRWRIQLPASA